MSRKIIVALIILLILAQPVIVAREARAIGSADLLQGVAMATFKCTLAGLLDGIVSGLLEQAERALAQFDPLGFLTGLLPGGPDEVIVLKDFEAKTKDRKDCIANELKRLMIELIRDDFLNWLANEDNPRFITDFREYLLDAEAGAEGEFRSALSTSGICPQNRHIVFTLLGGQDAGWENSDNSGQNIVRCSVADVLDIENGGLENYYADFRNGGWDAWIELNKFQNTPLGQYAIAKNTRDQLKEITKQAKDSESVASQGFKAATKEVCLEEVEVNLGQGLVETQCVRYAEKIKTPGKTIADQTNQLVSAEIQNLIGADEWDEIVMTILTILANEIFDRGLDIGL